MGDAPAAPARLLIADDAPEIVLALTMLLGGATDVVEIVGTATDGQQALQLARETKPDIILMDLRMPGMDGMTAAKAIRSEFPDVKVIIHSAADDPDLQELGAAIGAVDYLVKGASPSHLVETLARVAAA